MGVAHLALDLGPGGERRHRVDHHHVERAGADQHVGDLERLFAGVGLGDQQLVDIDPDAGGVGRVHGVLGVDVGADAAVALGLGDDVHGQGGLARGLRTEDLDHTATREPADAEGDVQRERPVDDGLDVHRGLLAHLHDRALAELLLDLAEGHLECLLSFHCHVFSSFVGVLRRAGAPVGETGYDRFAPTVGAGLRTVDGPYRRGVTLNAGRGHDCSYEQAFDQAFRGATRTGRDRRGAERGASRRRELVAAARIPTPSRPNGQGTRPRRAAGQHHGDQHPPGRRAPVAGGRG